MAVSTSSASEIDQLLQSLGFLPSGTSSQGHDGGEKQSRSTSIKEPSNVTSNEDAAKLALETPTDLIITPTIPKPEQSPPVIKRHEDDSHSMFAQAGKFLPIAPETLQEAGLHITEVSDLILKYLALRGIETGYRIARQVGMKFPVIEGVLRQLKVDRLVSYKNSSAGGDYMYELTESGRDRARSISEQNSYLGTAPVPLPQYIESVNAQTLNGRQPPLSSILAAFEDMVVGEQMISRIGQAIHSGRGMFLFGPPGNGKTSMAERITKSFGDTIWIPRTITASGEIIRLFDPNRHIPAPPNGCDPEYLDGRWIQIERPTIIAGGELRMENLEITYIRRTGVGEAPLQMKANCGTLLIDDFGRQRMNIDELLNRWIVPLEQRYDYLHLESGRSIQMPFDQLIIFSSNLEPKDLVDEAFLRRIPYKIEVQNPSEQEFRNLFRMLTAKLEFQHDEEVLDYLIQTHYHKAQRTFRFCQPRDLLRQMENHCSLHQIERIMTREAIDEAVQNYFSIM